MPPATPARIASWPTVAPRNGLEVVGWMRRKHPSRDLKTLRFTLTTEYHADSSYAKQAVVYASLPGKVRVQQMPFDTRTGDVRDRQRLAVFRSGRRVATSRRVDLRTLLAFDVFAQNADTTIMWLDSANVRYGVARRDEFNRHPVWVVGALDSDSSSAQFWVDADSWRLVRVIEREPRAPAIVSDVRYTDYTELLDVPVPTRIEIWREGHLVEVQTLSDFEVNPPVPSRAFDLARWHTINAGT